MLKKQFLQENVEYLSRDNRLGNPGTRDIEHETENCSELNSLHADQAGVASCVQERKNKKET